MSHRSTVSQRIAREIHEQILNKNYSPGERLPTERELAIHYGVSRIPVREAMKILEQRGIIEAKHGSGNYVTNIDIDKITEQIAQYVMLSDADINDLHIFWNILENYTVTYASLHRTQEECEQIKQLAADCAAEIKSAIDNQPCAFSEADLALHGAIAMASGSKIAANLVFVFHKSMRLKESIVAKRPEDLGKLIGIHDSIVKGIERQDPEMAMQAMHEDLNLGVRLIKEFRQRYKMNEIFTN